MTTIRPARAADAGHIRIIAETCGLFAPEEVPLLLETFAPEATGSGTAWFLSPHGAAMVEPEPFSAGLWNLRFIAVRPEARRGGEGRALVATAEAHAGSAGGRLLLVDTQGDETTMTARSFYAALDYEREAVIRDYFGDGIDKVTFCRRLSLHHEA
ncbi:GNAT family N-acetyltransferase [Jannaschia aquimarina]|uniref:Acetyltransferase (GNAT) family protein n=1 Tax=Jannaschia aquimarina TaxID=935700 RepID=A0A0D1EG72_9RHOB|nr:GNAT family N-acetyltransferase [Jannaschia aquimarina]KIT15911.1 Acetyltransferase (GNAT) family protein [Jannaschia aquimarina]SNS97622.1 Ribosomal protein S18 acetylase RimI [Jannaschia aquimarina]